MLYDEPNSKFYSIGGTDGHFFRMDVHSLAKNDDGKWAWTELNTSFDVSHSTGSEAAGGSVICLPIVIPRMRPHYYNVPVGRNGLSWQGLYRMEAALYGKKIFIFGGGTPEEVRGFKEVTLTYTLSDFLFPSIWEVGREIKLPLSS